MSSKPIHSALILALLTTLTLTACNHDANLSEQQLVQRAKDFEDKGDHKASVIELKNALQKNPNSPQARLLLGEIYLKAGMGPEAENELSKAEKLGINHESIKPQLGEALLLMGEYKRVLDEIQPGEQTSKANLARIYQIRADAMLKQGNLKDACNLFQQSLNINASSPPTYWGLAQCAVADRDVTKARTLLDTALKINSGRAKTWIYIGDLEQFNKNSQAALIAYTNALKSEPNNLVALENRAALYMALGQLDSARADIEKVGKLAPKSLTSHYLQALLSFELKKYPEALDSIQAVLQTAPDHMPSILLAGATNYALGSYQQAESQLIRFLSRFPGHAYARRLLAATQMKLNQPDSALATLAPILSANSQDAQALSLAGEAYLLQREPARATEYLTRAALIDPKNATIQTQLGLTHLATGDSPQAVTELGKAAALNAGQSTPDILLVMAHLERKEYDLALAAADAMEKKYQQSAISRTMRGSAYLGKNDIANARNNFEQALKIDPTFFPAAASLAQLDLRDKKPEIAKQRFERILDKDKNNLQAMMALAELAASSNQEKEYVNWLEKAAKSHPTAIPPRAVLARHYLSEKEPQKALAIANATVVAHPDDPVALDLLGTVQLALNDKTGAISTYTKLTQKADQSPDAFQRLAIAQIADNKLADARTTLMKALKLKPDHQPSLDTLIRLEMKEHKPEKALQIARQFEVSSPQSPFGFEREGDIQLNQKHPALAAKAYEKALFKGAGSTGLIKLHRANILAGNTVVAEQLLGKWIKQNPNDLAVRAYAAENSMANGKNKDAIAYYEGILQQTPQNATVLNNLAGLYLSMADSRARPTAEQALKLDPENPAFQDTLGWILVEQGQATRGLDLLNKSLAKAPKNVAIRYHHAIALARTGDKASARKELELLLKDAPNSPEAQAARAQLQKL